MDSIVPMGKLTENIKSSKKPTWVSSSFLNWLREEKNLQMTNGVACALFLVGSWASGIPTKFITFPKKIN
jgi:hypothetical protein